MEIRRLGQGSPPQEIKTALRLALRVFLGYDAPLFVPEGKEQFRAYIYSGTIEEAIDNGTACIYAAYEGDMIGIIGINGEGHIILAFVDGDHQHMGVGSALMEALMRDFAGYRLTVNAAPPGYGFYRRHGFVPTSPDVTTDGLTYTPMAREQS
ncbi:MAG: GNAT family N-acetyltransferase [Oscillospiraceae bacterium]|nr:GNAT family N-acetyltransferase [Oscillospiraceae bacterium]